MEHRPREQRARRGIALVLALFVLAWFADRAHVAFESHRWCDEHRRVEHADVGSGHAAPGCAHPEDAGPQILPGAAVQHHACAVLLARGEDPPTLLPASATALRAPEPHRAGLPARDRSASLGSIPLVLLAPKQSPPVS